MSTPYYFMTSQPMPVVTPSQQAGELHNVHNNVSTSDGSNATATTRRHPRTVEEIRRSVMEERMHSPETQAFKRMRSELDGALARIALAERNNEQLMGVVLANQVAQAEKEKKQAADEQMALDTIFSAIHNLEEILLQSRPGNTVISIRRQLDDARLFAPHAFTVLFPTRYQFPDMTYWFDTRKQIEWKKFRNMLNGHFKLHFEVDSDEFEVTQIQSAFRDCSLEHLIEKYDDTEQPPPVRGLPVLQVSPMPNTSCFKRRYFAPWNLREDRFLHYSNDNHTATLLLFFIPAFVWAYSELKKAIEIDDRRIQLLEYWHNRNLLVVNMVMRNGAPEDPPEPQSRDFTVGSGFKIRSAKYWQNFFNEEKRENTGPGAAPALLAAPTANGPGPVHWQANYVAGHASTPYVYVGGQVAVPYIGGQALAPYVGGQIVAPCVGGQAPAHSIGFQGVYGQDLRSGHHVVPNEETDKINVSARIRHAEHAEPEATTDPKRLKGSSKDTTSSHLDPNPPSPPATSSATDGTTSSKSLFDVELQQLLCSERMVDIEAKLLKEKKRRNTHFERFQTIRKFLLLVLDNRLFSLVVRGSSVVHAATNRFVQNLSEHSDDAILNPLTQVQEIVNARIALAKEDKEEVVNIDKNAGEDAELDINIVEDMDRLRSVITDADGYFENRDNEVEKHIDNYLLRLHRQVTSDGSTYSDLHILMSWFERFMPANEPNDAMDDD